MATSNYDGHGGFVKMQSRVKAPPRAKGTAPAPPSWVSKPTKKSPINVGGRPATRHRRPGATSPVQPPRNGG